MIKLSTSKSMNAMKTKFTFIYILNCTDILFTYTLLKTGDFYEANFIMRPIVSNPFLSVLIKIILPAILILGLLPHINEDKQDSLRLCTIFINIVILAYLVINFFHIYYLVTLLSF